MTENGKLDANAVRADLASGMTVAAVAVKYGRAHSTISHYVPRNGAKPSRAAKREAAAVTARANGHKAKSNGEGSGLAVKGNRDEIAELNRFLDERFQRLAVIEKIRILLARSCGVRRACSRAERFPPVKLVHLPWRRLAMGDEYRCKMVGDSGEVILHVRSPGQRVTVHLRLAPLALDE